MKILIATGVYPPEAGGPATYTKLLEEHLPAFGWAVSVLPFRRVRALPKIVRHVVFLWQEVLLGMSADVLYAQDVVSVGFPTLIAAKLLRKRFVVRVPGDYAWEQGRQRFGVTDSVDDFQKRKYSWPVEVLRFVQRIVVRHADLVVTPSNYFTSIVSEWLPPGGNAVQTVYNGIRFPEQLPSREGARRFLNLSHDDKIILSAGRLVPWKGFDVLIDVIADLSVTDPSWRLLILGDGPERKNLEAVAKEKGTGEKVFFLGERSREEMFMYCRAADVFMLNTSFESFSFMTVEVMSTGTPFVGTRVGSIPELVTDGVEGILLNPNDRQGFIKVARRITSDEAFRSALSLSAVEKSHRFSINATVHAMVALLQNLHAR